MTAVALDSGSNSGVTGAWRFDVCMLLVAHGRQVWAFVSTQAHALPHVEPAPSCAQAGDHLPPLLVAGRSFNPAAKSWKKVLVYDSNHDCTIPSPFILGLARPALTGTRASQYVDDVVTPKLVALGVHSHQRMGPERERERERESFRNNLHNGVVSGAAQCSPP